MSVRDIETVRDAGRGESVDSTFGDHSTGGFRESSRLHRQMARKREEFFSSLSSRGGIEEYLAERPRSVAALVPGDTSLDPSRLAARETLAALEIEKKRLDAELTGKELCLKHYGNLVNILDCIDNNIAAATLSVALSSAISRVERDELAPELMLDHLILGLGAFFEAFAATYPPDALARRYRFLEGPPGDVSPEIKDEIARLIEPILEAMDEALGDQADAAREAFDSAVRLHTTAMAVKAEATLYSQSLVGRISRVWKGLFGSVSEGKSGEYPLTDVSRSATPEPRLSEQELRARHTKLKKRGSVQNHEDVAKAEGLLAEALEASGDAHLAHEVSDLREELAYNERAIATNTDPSHMHARLTREERGEILATIERIKRELSRLGQSPHA